MDDNSVPIHDEVAIPRLDVSIIGAMSRVIFEKVGLVITRRD